VFNQFHAILLPTPLLRLRLTLMKKDSPKQHPAIAVNATKQVLIEAA
jgi:hypothetical protein